MLTRRDEAATLARMTEPMNSEQREQIRKAMSILAKRPRVFSEAMRAQRSKAGKNRWKSHKAKAMGTK